MKIIHLIDYFQPQLGYQETFLARCQVKNGHDVTVLTSERYFPYPNYRETVGKILGKRKKRKGISYFKEVKIISIPVLFELRTRVFLVGLHNEIKKINPDVIHIHGVLKITTLRMLKNRYKNINIIVDDHMHSCVRSNKYSIRFFYFLMRKIFSSKYNRIVNQTVGITEEITANFKYNYNIIDNSRTIELGVDKSTFVFSDEERNKLRKKYQIKKDDFVIIYTGKIINEKGPHLISKALEYINNENIKLMVVGDGQKKYINEMITIYNKNIFVGVVENKDLFKYYSVADIAIWPLQSSLAMLEAMSCKLPIIISDETLNSRISNKNGYIINCSNKIELANKIIYFINNKDERLDFGLKGRELVDKEYDWEIINRKFEDLYNEI